MEFNKIKTKGKKKANRKDGLQQRIKTRIVKMRWNDLTCRILAPEFGCSYVTISHAIGEKNNSTLERKIRKRIDALPLPGNS